MHRHDWPPDGLRVLAWPAPTPEDLNPYVSLVLRTFVPPHATLLPFTPPCAAVRPADIFLIQWPEGILEGRGGSWRLLAATKATLVLMAADRIRRRGGIVALTIHNLRPHRAMQAWQRRLWNRYIARLLARTDVLVALSPATLNAFRLHHAAARALRAIVAPHPHYRTVYPAIDREQARSALALTEQPVIGIIGSLRPSKRTPEAIAAFRAASTPVHLVVAGEADDGHWTEIVAAADADPRIHLRRGRLGPDELAMALAGVDLVLLNQSQGLNSGMALLALSLGRPLLAPRTVAMTELQEEFGADWVDLFDAPLDAAAFDAARCAGRHHHARYVDAIDRRDPDVISRQLLEDLAEEWRRR